MTLYVIAGLDPAIQRLLARACYPWMPGSRLGMTGLQNA